MGLRRCHVGPGQLGGGPPWVRREPHLGPDEENHRGFLEPRSKQVVYTEWEKQRAAGPKLRVELDTGNKSRPRE